MNILFNGVFGSRLYGLSRPESDEDFKGVYLPTKRELIFNNYKDSIEKQTEDQDTTLYAATKFIKIAGKCDTVSFDMIHTPKQFTLESSDLWNKFKSYRQDLYCKDMRGILGYIRTQATKYGHKQERFNEMTELLSMLDPINDNVSIVSTDLVAKVVARQFKYITYNKPNKNILANIDVCGSRYQINANNSYLRLGLEAKLEKYGKRTIKGSVSGGDYKSISHSLRVLYQLQELIETRDLVFPLVKAPEIMEVKLGQVPYDQVIDNINSLYEEVTTALEKSDLPEYNSTQRFEDELLNYIELTK